MVPLADLTPSLDSDPNHLHFHPFLQDFLGNFGSKKIFLEKTMKLCWLIMFEREREREEGYVGDWGFNDDLCQIDSCHFNDGIYCYLLILKNFNNRLKIKMPLTQIR